jgi:hypothetical protein
MAKTSPLPQVVIKDESWITRYWRPMMAWQYFTVCIFDFIIFPLIAFHYAKETGNEFKWDPMTLKDSGFYHMTMGVVIGVSAWTRGQENLERTRMFGQAILQGNNSSPQVNEGEELEGQNPPRAPSRKQGG